MTRHKPFSESNGTETTKQKHEHAMKVSDSCHETIKMEKYGYDDYCKYCEKYTGANKS